MRAKHQKILQMRLKLYLRVRRVHAQITMICEFGGQAVLAVNIVSQAYTIKIEKNVASI